jgi:hypothetical protein
MFTSGDGSRLWKPGRLAYHSTHQAALGLPSRPTITRLNAACSIFLVDSAIDRYRTGSRCSQCRTLVLPVFSPTLGVRRRLASYDRPPHHLLFVMARRDSGHGIGANTMEVRVMRIAIPVVLLACCCVPIHADQTDLGGGVLITHHPPGLQFSTGMDVCEHYASQCAITCCDDQNVRIDLRGAAGKSSVWYVLGAWSEEKEWCGVEFGFEAFDPAIYVFTAWGPCTPNGGLEVPAARVGQPPRPVWRWQPRRLPGVATSNRSTTSPAMPTKRVCCL